MRREKASNSAVGAMEACEDVVRTGRSGKVEEWIELVEALEERIE